MLFKFCCDCVVLFLLVLSLNPSPSPCLPHSQYLSMLITHKMKDKQEIRWEDEKSIRTGGGHHYAFAPPSEQEGLSLATKSMKMKEECVHV